MVLEADARETKVSVWVRVSLLLSALLTVALGIAMLVQPQMPLFAALSGPWLARQAVGILQAATGGALIAAFLRPRRNVNLITAGLVLELAGIVTLLFLAVTGGAEWGATWGLLGVVLAVALLLGLPLLAMVRAPEPEPLVAELRPMPTTTLFGLQQTLQALAAPATVQLAMFPDLIENGERVMAEFQQWRERALQKRDSMTPQQQEALRGLDASLHRMLTESAAGLWSGDAVRSSPEWSQLRAAARRALVSFSWSVDMPLGVLKRRREVPSSVDLRPPS